jgi:hypothetical protein
VDGMDELGGLTVGRLSGVVVIETAVGAGRPSRHKASPILPRVDLPRLAAWSSCVSSPIYPSPSLAGTLLARAARRRGDGELGRSAIRTSLQSRTPHPIIGKTITVAYSHGAGSYPAEPGFPG